MKKILLLFLCALSGIILFAQDQPKSEKKKSNVINLAGRANDHFMIQLGYTGWSKKPDSINTTGIPRSFNMYVMFDFPIKSNPHYSLAIGPGIATDNMYFSKTYVGLKDPTTNLVFYNLADTNHFKRYKLATTWLEAPVEFRFSSDPANPNKSYKFAIGVKLATLLGAHTKGKTWEDKNGRILIAYTQKETAKRFINTTRFEATARVAWGVFGLYGSYQLNSLFKEGSGPGVRAFSIGLTVSGL
jgi:hypothetical protein